VALLEVGDQPDVHRLPLHAPASQRARRRHVESKEGTHPAKVIVRGLGIDRDHGHERTFFRHFADKREVLFDGAAELQELLVSTVADAAESLAPIAAVGQSLEAAGAVMRGRRDFARQRQAIIAASAELRERELIKLASLSAALAETLRGRGVPEPDASLTAEAGIAVFRIAFERWVDEANELDLPDLMRDSLDHLRAVTGAV